MIPMPFPPFPPSHIETIGTPMNYLPLLQLVGILWRAFPMIDIHPNISEYLGMMISDSLCLGKPHNHWLPSWDMLPQPLPLLLYLGRLPDPFGTPFRCIGMILKGLPHPGMSSETWTQGPTAHAPFHNPRFLMGPGPTITIPIPTIGFHLLPLGECFHLSSLTPE